jgi:hypothetical protein
MRTISISSSRTACTSSLLPSTIASGSTKRVAPLWERSWTMPRSRLLASARIGNT